jgi:hypothetical protein
MVLCVEQHAILRLLSIGLFWRETLQVRTYTPLLCSLEYSIWLLAHKLYCMLQISDCRLTVHRNISDPIGVQQAAGWM